MSGMTAAYFVARPDREKKRHFGNVQRAAREIILHLLRNRTMSPELSGRPQINRTHPAKEHLQVIPQAASWHRVSPSYRPHLDTAAHDGASPARSRPDTRRRSCRKCSCRPAAVGTERRPADTRLHLKHMKPAFESNSTSGQTSGPTAIASPAKQRWAQTG